MIIILPLRIVIMKAAKLIDCEKRPCLDVNKKNFTVPNVEIDPKKIRALIISEVPPPSSGDYYYKGGESLFERTTLQAYQDAGLDFKSFLQLVEF